VQTRTQDMIRKTALLTGIAGLMLTAAPALAQDAMTAPANQTPPAAESSGTLSLQPGSDVKGSDGSVLGKLEGVQNNAAGEQELTVRGADGQLRGVPLGGLKQDGAGVSVAWTTAEYQAAPAITDDAATPSTSTPPAEEPSEDSAEPVEPQ
jgi:hypothetical protein